MCYICEAKGTVGKNYKATQKMIAAAKRALPRGQPFHNNWEKAPPVSQRLWGSDSLKAYAKSRS